MARTYLLPHCDATSEQPMITAIDARDVEPLKEALLEIAIYRHGDSERQQELARAALATFEEGDQ